MFCTFLLLFFGSFSFCLLRIWGGGAQVWPPAALWSALRTTCMMARYASPVPRSLPLRLTSSTTHFGMRQTLPGGGLPKVTRCLA